MIRRLSQALDLRLEERVSREVDVVEANVVDEWSAVNAVAAFHGHDARPGSDGA